MIENRIVHYNPFGWTHGCSVTDNKWGVTIYLRNTQDVLNFYNFFGFVLSDLKKEETTLGYYHWSNARISTPISFTSKDYIFERDNVAQKDRIEIENNILGDFTTKIKKMNDEKSKIYKKYDFFSMSMWFWLCFMTCCMCPVYIIKKKQEKKLIAEINRKIDETNKSLFDVVDSEITKFEESKESKDELSKKNKSNNSNESISYIEELKDLKELLDSGIITKEEFETKKKQILN